MGAVSIERLTMVWEMRLVLPVVDLDHHWQLALRWCRALKCVQLWWSLNKNWPWRRQWWWLLGCYQVSSDGGHILATELVCFVNCPAFPLTPVPGVVFNWGQNFSFQELNICERTKSLKVWYVIFALQTGDKTTTCLMLALHEVLENSDAEGMSQSASREQDDPRLHNRRRVRSFACQVYKVWEVNNLQNKKTSEPSRADDPMVLSFASTQYNLRIDFHKTRFDSFFHG